MTDDQEIEMTLLYYIMYLKILEKMMDNNKCCCYEQFGKV